MAGSVKGRGSIESGVLLLGEKPGQDELRLGKVFVGRTGVELDRICWKAGVNLNEVWLDNLLEDAPTGEDWSVTDEDIERNMPHVLDIFDRGRFHTVVAMGNVANRFLLGEGVRSDVGTVHGLTHTIDNVWCEAPKQIKVFSTWHPAAGFHDGDAYPYIMYDFQLLGAFLKGWDPGDRVDECPNPRYSPITDSDNDVKFLRHLFKFVPVNDVVGKPIIFVDTEGNKKKPWCLSFSLKPGEAYMIQAKHQKAIDELKRQVEQWRMVFGMHHGKHDPAVLRRMGWEVIKGTDSILDTMVAAYLLQIEPQGLKNAAYRHCGMLMQDYVDLIGPYSFEKQLEWLLRISEVSWGKPEPVLVEEKMSTRLVQPQALNTRINKIIEKFEHEQHVDIWEWWKRLKGEYSSITTPVIEGFGDIPQATLDDVPFDQAMWYACRDADATNRLFWKYADRLKQFELWDTFLMDCAVIPHIEEMEDTGFKTDPEHFKRLNQEWREEQGRIRKKLSDMVGFNFNPESSKQAEYVIYDLWKMPVFKETKGGARGTSDKAIDWMKDRHPGIGLIARSREYDKGRTSFCLPILRFGADDPDNRLHGDLKYTRVVSGRFSMAEPNLLAMPVRSDLGKLIRDGFVARDGCLLGSWDLNQIEMRFMAHESQDADLIKAYERDKDIHKETACRMFGCREEDVDAEQREVAKRISFGVITGIQGAGLRDQFWLNGITKYDEDDCNQFIRIWFEARRGVANYLEACRSEARRNGYVRESVGGRIRYLQSIQSINKKIAAEAERASHSHKISSGAQAILKKSMAAGWDTIRWLREADGVWIKWILQVHDELILEFEEGYEEVLDAIMQDVLCNTVRLRVPIKAKGKWSKTWGKLK